jgi:hypothetical protein
MLWRIEVVGPSVSYRFGGYSYALSYAGPSVRAANQISQSPDPLRPILGSHEIDAGSPARGLDVPKIVLFTISGFRAFGDDFPGRVARASAVYKVACSPRRNTTPVRPL